MENLEQSQEFQEDSELRGESVECLSIKEIANPGSIRRAIKAIIFVLPVLGGMGCGGDDKPSGGDKPSSEDETKLEVDNLSEFETDKILIYSDCSQVDDYARSLKNTARRYKEFKLSRTNNNLWEGRYKNRDITVACDRSNINGEYDIINVRGHTGDMRGLVNQSRSFFKDHVTLILGGCDSSSFVPEFADNNIAVIGGSGTQDTANNNYLILQLPKGMEDNNS